MALVTSTSTGLASSRYGRYSTPKRIKNIASEAARLMVNPTPRSAATPSSMRALGHSWRCTGKSFSKVPKSKVCIECLDLTRARENAYFGSYHCKEAVTLCQNNFCFGQYCQ